MYAVIRTGGKQYKVQPGDVLQVEKLEKDLGSEFDISDVLAIGGDAQHIGNPLVKNAKVTVVVTKQARDRKVIVFKKNRRHGYRKFKTHKQHFTELFVKSITSPNGQTAKTDSEPKVVDMAKARVEKIEAKVAERKERVSNKTSEEAPKAAKKATKKVAAKKAVKKTAKKTVKKAVKKVAKKKTSKKA
jgi:large subunit ribosomal protein L21